MEYYSATVRYLVVSNPSATSTVSASSTATYSSTSTTTASTSASSSPEASQARVAYSRRGSIGSASGDSAPPLNCSADVTTVSRFRFPESKNKRCGPNELVMCPAGQCCSQWGWCGNETSHCGKGCKPAYGVCGSETPDAAAAPVPFQTLIVLLGADEGVLRQARVATGYLEEIANVSGAAKPKFIHITQARLNFFAVENLASYHAVLFASLGQKAYVGDDVPEALQAPSDDKAAVEDDGRPSVTPSPKNDPLNGDKAPSPQAKPKPSQAVNAQRPSPAASPRPVPKAGWKQAPQQVWEGPSFADLDMALGAEAEAAADAEAAAEAEAAARVSYQAYPWYINGTDCAAVGRRLGAWWDGTRLAGAPNLIVDGRTRALWNSKAAVVDVWRQLFRRGGGLYFGFGRPDEQACLVGLMRSIGLKPPTVDMAPQSYVAVDEGEAGQGGRHS